MSEYADRCLPHSKPIKHNLDCHSNPCKVKKPCLSVVRRGKQIPCNDGCDNHQEHHHHHHGHHHSSSSSSECHDHHSHHSSSSSSSSECHQETVNCVCGECSD